MRSKTIVSSKTAKFTVLLDTVVIPPGWIWSAHGSASQCYSASSRVQSPWPPTIRFRQAPKPRCTLTRGIRGTHAADTVGFRVSSSTLAISQSPHSLPSAELSFHRPQSPIHQKPRRVHRRVISAFCRLESPVAALNPPVALTIPDPPLSPPVHPHISPPPHYHHHATLLLLHASESLLSLLFLLTSKGLPCVRKHVSQDAGTTHPLDPPRYGSNTAGINASLYFCGVQISDRVLLWLLPPPIKNYDQGVVWRLIPACDQP